MNKEDPKKPRGAYGTNSLYIEITYPPEWEEDDNLNLILLEESVYRFRETIEDESDDSRVLPLEFCPDTGRRVRPGISASTSTKAEQHTEWKPRRYKLPDLATIHINRVARAEEVETAARKEEYSTGVAFFLRQCRFLRTQINALLSVGEVEAATSTSATLKGIQLKLIDLRGTRH